VKKSLRSISHMREHTKGGKDRDGELDRKKKKKCSRTKRPFICTWRGEDPITFSLKIMGRGSFPNSTF